MRNHSGVISQPALDVTRNTWLRAHVAMCEWFGGSTPRLVCDNLRTGVIRHPREGEIVLNDAYRGMAGHYSAAVLPGRVKRCILMLLYIVKGFGGLGWLVRGGDGLDPECGASFEFG